MSVSLSIYDYMLYISLFLCFCLSSAPKSTCWDQHLYIVTSYVVSVFVCCFKWYGPHLNGVCARFLSHLCRFTEKGNLEVLLFTIQSKMRANNQKVYMPREGKLISDINKVGDTQPRSLAARLDHRIWPANAEAVPKDNCTWTVNAPRGKKKGCYRCKADFWSVTWMLSQNCRYSVFGLLNNKNVAGLLKQRNPLNHRSTTKWIH